VLKALLGKSERCMLWHVVDERMQGERLVLMPRAKPADPVGWVNAARSALKVEHPSLAPASDVGVVDGHAYLAYDRALGQTLDERLARHRICSPAEAAAWAASAAQALAAVHEAGQVVGDLQPFQWLLASEGKSLLLGLGFSGQVTGADAAARQRLRDQASEEVLCMGLLFNRLLGGAAPLETTDPQEVVRRLPPQGKDFVRLGFDAAHPVPEPVRAICNRGTATQPTQRYPSARAFAHALEAWLDHQRHPEGGSVGQLVDRLQRFGGLPVTRPEAVRSIQAGGLEQQHSGALANLVLQDLSLSFELLRRVNQARAREGRVGDATVLSVQRAVAMLGLKEVGAAASALRLWPGLLPPERVLNLRLALARAHKAADVARMLAPAGYEPDIVRLITYTQNLGRLMLQYHLPDEADQIERLMQAPPPTEEHPHPQGMSEQQAAFAVLGCDLDDLTHATLRHWSLAAGLQKMASRPAIDSPVHHAGTDTETLRLTAALAVELVDALALPEPKRRQSIEHATRRYARALSLSARDIQLALYPEAAQAAVVRTRS
jgi:non-specific serine/threonine protein kinase